MRTLLIFLLSLTSIAIRSQVPAGGIMLNSSTGNTYQGIGQCTVTREPVTGQPFTEALRIVVGTGVSNAWDGQVQFPAVEGIQDHDVVLVAFYARTISSVQETGEGKLTLCIERKVTWEKELYHHLSIGHEWKEYYAPVECKNSISSASVNYAFHVGYPSQTIEVAEVRFLNYKNTLSLDELPETELSYAGQDPDASWRAPAAARINQIRKGRADIMLYDAQGLPLQYDTLSIQMAGHKFGFGTAIAAGTFNSNATYRNKVLEMFNEVVFENDLKWTNFNPGSVNLHLSRALDTLEARQVRVRGHTVIWPSFKYCPPELQDLSGNPVALRNAIDQRIDDVTGFTEGRLIDWDVLNEPYSEDDLQEILGDEAMAEWFRRVRRNDRGVKLYINDYSILSAGGQNKAHQDYYYEVIQYIDSLGGGIEGIGMQGHFATDFTPIEKVYEILDRFAGLGKEIKITEHDIATRQQAVQADYTRDFLTIVFSHPAVESLLMWGFWEGRHWKPEAAFFNLDWTIRPHGEVWNDLIYNQWWTPDTLAVSDDQGRFSFEGFLGTYSFTIFSGGIERSGTFAIEHSLQSGLSNPVVISLDDAMPGDVRITPSVPGFLCQGEEVILQAPEGTGLNYTWFLNDSVLSELSSSLVTGDSGIYRVKISKEGIEIESPPYLVEVRPHPESLITPSGELAFCDGGVVTLNGTGVAGMDYEWWRDDTRFRGGTPTLEVDQPGIFTLETSSFGCSSLSDPVEVEVWEVPEATITSSGELAICEGTTVTLSAGLEPDLFFAWAKDGLTTDSTEQSIMAGQEGSYSVIVSNQHCSAISEPAVVTFLSPQDPVCVTGLEAYRMLSNVYPNPCRESCFVKLPEGSNQDTRIDVFNPHGHLMVRKMIPAGTSFAEVPLSEPGFYMVCVQQGNESQSYKIVSSH